MRSAHLFTLFIMISSLVINIDARKKKNDDRKPVSIESLLYCNSCQAVIREMLKKIGNSHKESDITDAISSICSQRNFSIYEYPPPDMMKGCEAFIGGWSEEVELALMNRENNQVIEDQICGELTNACKNIERGQRKGNDDYVTINGKKVKMNDDGRVDVNMQSGPSDNDDL